MKYVFLAPVVNDLTHERRHFLLKIFDNNRELLIREHRKGFFKHTHKKTSYFRFPSLCLLKILEKRVSEYTSLIQLTTSWGLIFFSHVTPQVFATVILSPGFVALNVWESININNSKPGSTI